MFTNEFKNFNIIPLPKNTKIPDFKWEKYIKEKYNKELPENNSNFAVICGKVSNLIILDLDLKKKEYFNNIYDKFQEEFPILSQTLIISTPHGYHLYYEPSPNMDVERNPNSNARYNKKLKFTGWCKTNFAEYLKGFDILGDKGYALIPPSEINNKKYDFYNKNPIKKITKSDFNKIKNFFLKPKPSRPRLPFIKFLNGEIDIEDQSGKTGKKEFIYWKYLFIECYNMCGLYPYELYKGLKHNQSSFNQKEIEQQLNYEYHSYTNKPLKNTTLIEYFPDYQPKIEQKVLNKIDKTNGVLQIIDFNSCRIKLRKDDVIKSETRIKKEIEYEVNTLILDGGLDILHKTRDINQIDLFTFEFKNRIYHTLSIENSLKKLQDQIYCGYSGKDIIKRVFNVIGDQMEELLYKDEYILGFHEGWKLPQVEMKGRFLLILYTDYQIITYNRSKDILKNYTEIEKEKIRNNFEDFLRKTQVDPIKHSIIIGWAMAAPFRLPLLDFCDIFPILYLYGIRHSGKSYLERFYIIDFFGIYKRALSPNILESTARLEDHLSESTFPHNIQEIDKVNNNMAIPLIKDHATFSTDYERKKSARELDFKKQKVAPLCLDSNNAIDKLKDAAANSKILLIEHTNDDKVIVDEEWKKLFYKLSKEKLFSFIYNYTIDWDNSIIKERLDVIKQNIKEELGEETYNTIDMNNPRIINIYQIILFGIELFENSFNINIEKTLKIKKSKILSQLLEGRQVLPSDLRDKFIHFCILAMNYEEDYEEDHETFSKLVRGRNPKFLTVPLKGYKDEWYVFTQDNLRDFNDYTGHKDDYNLKTLTELVIDSLSEKEKNCNVVEYGRPYLHNKKGVLKQMRATLINKKWLNGNLDVDDIDEIDPDKMNWKDDKK